MSVMCHLCTAQIPCEKPRYWWLIDETVGNVCACLRCMNNLERDGLGMHQTKPAMYAVKKPATYRSFGEMKRELYEEDLDD